MSLYLSHLLADLRQARLTRRGATHTPDQVPQGTHKAYPRMQQIPLPQPEAIKQTLGESLHARQSYVGGSAEKKITPQELGSLLGSALGKRQGSGRRQYPSGGALYPIETYILTNTFGENTIFHYNPTTHSLEKLLDISPQFDTKKLARHPEDQLFSTMIIFTSVWARSSAKYGDLSFLHALLEAGHMSQNILLTATALGLQSRPYAGFDDEEISKLLDLRTEREQIVHTVLLSR